MLAKKQSGKDAAPTLDRATAQTYARKELLSGSFSPLGGVPPTPEEAPEDMQRKDPLATQVWRLYSKQKNVLPNAERMENLTWRMMALTLKRERLVTPGVLDAVQPSAYGEVPHARLYGSNAPLFVGTGPTQNKVPTAPALRINLPLHLTTPPSLLLPPPRSTPCLWTTSLSHRHHPSSVRPVASLAALSASPPAAITYPHRHMLQHTRYR